LDATVIQELWEEFGRKEGKVLTGRRRKSRKLMALYILKVRTDA